MNERIKQLAEQAGWTIVMGTRQPIDHRDYVVSPEQAKKFAELIINECCQVYESEVDTWQNMAPYQGSIKRTGTSSIKGHFGVTE